MEEKRGTSVSKKITDFLNHPIIQLLGLSGVLAVITWITTRIAEQPLWEIWLAIVFIVGCSIWIMNQINIWKEWHKKKLSQRSDKEIENIVHEWVDIPDLTFKRSDVPDFYFMFTLTDKFHQVISVARHKTDPKYISIWTDVAISSHPTRRV